MAEAQSTKFKKIFKSMTEVTSQIKHFSLFWWFEAHFLVCKSYWSSRRD